MPRFTQNEEKVREIVDYLESQGWEVESKPLASAKTADGSLSLQIRPGQVSFVIHDEEGPIQGSMRMDMTKMTPEGFVRVISRLIGTGGRVLQ